MSFLGSLFGGSNPTLNSQIGNLTSLAGSTSKTGLSSIGDAASYFHDILQGGGKKVLAPQIGSIQKQGQQQKQVLSQFGNRGGGTNAEAATIGDKTNSSVNDLVANLTAGAASGSASLGTNLLSTSLSASNSAVNDSQLQMQNWMDSILGKGITSPIVSAEGFALGKAFPADE